MSYKSKKTSRTKEVVDNATQDEVVYKHVVPTASHLLPERVNRHYNKAIDAYKTARCQLASQAANVTLVREVKDVDVSINGLQLVYTIFVDQKGNEVWLLKQQVDGQDRWSSIE